MLLIPEQIYDIKKAIVEITHNKEKHYEDMMKSKELTGFESTCISAQSNNPSQNIYQKLRHKVNELDRLLNTSHIIDERNLEKIDIGTFFYYKWIDEDEIESAYLVEILPIPSIDNKFISVESPIGKSVKGAKEGDIIKYKTRDDMPIQTIQIIKISKDKDDYLQLISNNNTNKIYTTIKEETEEILNYLSSITESQKHLIRIKLKKLKDKLLRIDGSEEQNQIKKEIVNLEEKLQFQIKDTPNDDTIGIGSIIDFSLNNGYVYSLELIGRAYTTEYPCQYVEYISSLGKALYGKKAGDNFTFIGTDRKKYTGEILNVYNKDYEEIDSPKTYKKLNS